MSIIVSDISDMEKVNCQLGWISVQNLEHQHIYSTLELASLCGFNTVNKFIGTTFREANTSIARFSSLWEQQNQQVIAKKQHLNYVSVINNLEGKEQLVLCSKSPIKDIDSKLLGVFVKCIKLSPQKELQSAMKELQDQISFEYQTQPFRLHSKYPGLSKRQSQCMYFLLLGKQSKQIATYLKITSRTVDTYIEAIKIKMNCSSRSELISKAHDLGFYEILPLQLNV